MSILANWFRSVFPAKRTPQDTQWPRPLPNSVPMEDALGDFSAALNRGHLLQTFSPEGAKEFHRLAMNTPLYPRMVQAVNEDRLKDTLKPQPDAWRKNFAKTPEQRKADHAKSVTTKALKKARTAELRAALQRSVEEA